MPEPEFCSRGSELNFISRTARSEHEPNFATFLRPPNEVESVPLWNRLGGHRRGRNLRPFFLALNPRRGRIAVAAHRLRIEFARHLDGGQAEIEQRTAAFLHEAGR